MSHWWRGCALFSLLLLLGCPPDDGSVPQAFPVLDAPPPMAAQTGVASAGADTREVLRICSILPESGPEVDRGAEIRRGLDLARSEVAGDSSRRFDWTFKDTKSTEPGALTAFQSCFNEGHHVVIGPVSPAATTALIPVAVAHDIVLLVPEIAAAVPVGWGGSLFAVSPPSSEMGRLAGANARRERGLTKGAVLHVGGVFGESLRDAFHRAFLAEEPGGVMVGSRELPPDDPDAWVAAAKELTAAGAEALFVVGPPRPSEAVSSLVGSQTRTQAWFIDWAMQPPVMDAAGTDGRPRVHWVNRVRPQGGFEASYVQRHQAKPEFPAGSGYDAVKLVEMASARSKSSWHEDLAAELKKLDGVPSAFGTGQMVEVEGVTFEDIGGYRISEPTKLPDSDVWVFGGYE